jgi:hypothetical protein
MPLGSGYIAVGGGTYKIVDSGNGTTNWTNTFTLPADIIDGYGIATDGSGQIVVTGQSPDSSHNIVYSTDGGMSWTAVNHIFKGALHRGSGVLYTNKFRDLSGKVFVAYGSDNNSQGGPHNIAYGKTDSPNWSLVNFSGFTQSGYIQDIATDSSNIFVIVGTTQTASPYHLAYSTDYGDTWSAVSGLFTSIGNGVEYGTAIVQSSQDASSVFIATGDISGSDSIYYCYSHTLGTWTGLGNPFGIGGYGNCLATNGAGKWLIGGKSTATSNNLYYTSDFSSGYIGISSTTLPLSEIFGLYYNRDPDNTPYWYALGTPLTSGTSSIYYSNNQDASSWSAVTGITPDTARSIMYGEIDIPCVAKGTKISTPLGYIPVEDLHEGDVILINKGEYANIRKIFHRIVKVTPITAPYRVPGGDGYEDLTISPTHSIFVRGQMIEAQFLGHPHDYRYTGVIEYYNISVDGDENTVMYANGVPIETYRERNNI